MVQFERKNKILELLYKEGYCSVEQLSKMLNVSQMTIRRDLSLLENENIVVRCHGGAGLISTGELTPMVVRENYEVNEKKAIAANALEKLPGAGSVYIDSSSTCLQLAKSLPPEYPITVVTNSVRVLDEVSEKKIKVYFTGGKYYDYDKACFGELAEKNLTNFHFDISFISPSGIVPSKGLFEFYEHEKRLRRLAMDFSDRIFVLCCVRKIEKVHPIRLGGFDEINEVICADKQTASLFKK